MQSPARQRDRCPIPPHSSVHALNLSLSTVDPLLTPLFAASPAISRLSPLSTAFTHFDRGVWVAFQFPLDSQLSVASRGSFRVFVYFQHLTKRSAAETLPNRFSTPFPLETYKSLFQQLLCFVIYTKHPGVTPPTFHRQPLGSGKCATLFPFSPSSNLSLAVPKNATYNLSPRLRSQSWQSSRKANRRNPPPRPTKPMANRMASRTPDPTLLSPRARPRPQPPPAPLLRLRERTKRKSLFTGKKKNVFIPR